MGARDRLPWLTDEYVIVGDLWQRRGRTVGIRDAEVREIAALFGRSPASISRRVGNFAGTENPGKGLKPITGEPLERWKEVRGNRAALERAVAQARARLALLTNGMVTSHVEAAGIRIIAPELPSVEPVAVVTKEAARQAEQSEAVLRERFRSWRDPRGDRLRGISIETPTSRLRVDLYDQLANVLIEVKAKAERDYLRFAIGQLYDYRRYLDFEVELAVLVPQRPTDDLMGLLDSAAVGAIWPDGAAFADSGSGRLLPS
ncbi:hypothetical protein ACTOB_008519 [Actinoplanes oblitus]|uniref:Uncharacterized protein n=1 Tax=Actinoplanes oblitus TaxID=3040509 RepID=A0ABY8WKR2_9ACTN|nr:hypothetical protein [Actinoplanes oblitus]WIM96330.1 hypothetical protein ACTOB_008519 [Actinoplanes oblitus]